MALIDEIMLQVRLTADGLASLRPFVEGSLFKPDRECQVAEGYGAHVTLYHPEEHFPPPEFAGLALGEPVSVRPYARVVGENAEALLVELEFPSCGLRLLRQPAPRRACAEPNWTHVTLACAPGFRPKESNVAIAKAKDASAPVGKVEPFVLPGLSGRLDGIIGAGWAAREKRTAGIPLPLIHGVRFAALFSDLGHQTG